MKFLKVLLAFSVISLVYSCVDDDQLIQETNLKTEERHDRIPGFNYPTPCEALYITYFVNGNCDGTVYEDAIVDGIQEFNNAPVGLFFIEVDNAADADIVMDCVDGDTCGEGVTSFPANNLSIPSSSIDFEIMWEFCQCTDDSTDCNFTGDQPACMFTRTVMHEIGHAIGIHHNGEGTWIPGTPNTGNDPNSIFNSGPVTSNVNCDWCDSPCVFSDNDLTALQIIYPECGCFVEENLSDVTVDGPSEFCFNTSDEKAVFCASGLPTGATISASGDGISSTTDGNCVLISFDDPGYITINIDICLDGCCRTIEKIIAADNQCCKTCYCECETIIEGTNPLQYQIVRNEISCLETDSCDEIFPVGDEYFNCKRIALPKELDYTIGGDDQLCWDEEGKFCIGGLSNGTGVEWVIYGPSGTITTQSSGSCLYITFSELGIYTVTAKICEGECCQVLTHKVEYSACEGCFCECWELIDDDPWGNSNISISSPNDEKIISKGKLKYRLVQLPIDCDDDCDKEYPIGDEYFDCKKIMM